MSSKPITIKEEAKLIKMGGGHGIYLPKRLLEILEVNEKDTLLIEAFQGAKGKFLAIYKK